MNFIFYFTLFIFLFFIDSPTFGLKINYKNINEENENLINDDEYDFADDNIQKNELDYQELKNDESTSESDKKLDYKLKDRIRNKEQKDELIDSPINTLLAITNAQIQFLHAILTGNETSKHAKEISDIIGYNLKKIIKKFFKIVNEALDNLNAINNSGLVRAIVEIANFMTKMNSFVNPIEWQSTLMRFDFINSIRLPLNLRSPNAHHEQIFDIDDLL